MIKDHMCLVMENAVWNSIKSFDEIELGKPTRGKKRETVKLNEQKE